jgi:hypothetical protein
MLSRLVLKGLMLTGCFVSRFLSRQMEYHADICAAEVAGTETLESLLLRLRERVLLERVANASLNQMWHQRRQLPNSLPEFLDEFERRLPAKFHEQARLTVINETTKWFATHPSAAERIQRARMHAVPGIFTLEKPALALFGDFPGTARLVTASYYRRNLRLPVVDSMLKPVMEILPPDASK